MDENSTALTAKSDIRDVIIAANAGDENALSILREQLKDESAKPLLKRVWGMASQVETSLLNSIFGDLLGSRELVEQQLRTMREDLGWAHAPRMEQVLIERVVQTWLYLHMIEIRQAQSPSLSDSKTKLFELRMEKAQRRHLKAIKMLATVRKMALPIQIDVRAQISAVGSVTAGN